jgi:hypothetical protein
MTQRFILLWTVLAAFAAAGCGDNANQNVCEDICDNNRCSDLPNGICEGNCEDFLDSVDCSREARDYFECLDDNNCDFDGECANERIDWVDCAF